MDGALSEWSCDEVYDWSVQKIGEKYADLLRQEEVDGAALLASNETHFRAYGIPGGPATKLCQAVKSLNGSKQQAQEMALDADHAAKLQTIAQLLVGWEAMGTPLEERQAQLSELSHRIQAVYQTRVREQREAQAQIEEQIAELQSAITALCEQLQIAAPDPIDAQAPLLQQMSVLSSQYEVTKQERDRQLQINGQALEELSRLYHILGDPLPSDLQRLQLGCKRITEIQALIAEAHDKMAVKKEKLEAAKERVYAQLQDLCLEDEEYSQLDRLVLLHPSEIPLSALQELNSRAAQLEEMNVDRKNKLKALARKIATMWNLLETPNEHRKQFMSGNAGLGRATFEKCEKELSDLEAQKRAQLPQLIEAAQKKLQALWEEACVPISEQKTFLASFQGVGNEAKFCGLRQQMAEMEKRLEDMKPILTNVLKREKMKADEKEYISLMSDPNRFKIAGLPLKLESMRRTFQGYPKLVAKMKEEIEAWEAVNGPLMRNGERLLSTMQALGEFEDGYMPGAGEPKRSNGLKVDSSFISPARKARCATAPSSSRRGTPRKPDCPNTCCARKKVFSTENPVYTAEPKDRQTPKRLRSPLRDCNRSRPNN